MTNTSMKKSEPKHPKRTLVAIVSLLGLVAGLIATSTMAGAQERENPWWVDRYPVAPDLVSAIGELDVRPNGRVAFDFPLGRVYGLPVDGIFVVTGADLLTFCLGDELRSEQLITFRQNGRFVTKTPPGGLVVSTYVYDTGGVEGFTWMFTACEAWAADGTPPPSPIATGFTTLRIRSNPSVPLWSAGDQPPGFYRNGLTGQVTGADGTVYDLHTFASFALTGEEQGPPDFVRHEVTMTEVAG